MAVSLLAALPPAAAANAASAKSPSVSPTVVVRTVIEGITATDPDMVCPNIARDFKKYMKRLAQYLHAYTPGRNSCREIAEDLYAASPPKPTRIAKLRWVGMQGDDIALVRLTDTKGKKELIVLVVERGAWKYRGGVCQYDEETCTEMGAWPPSGSRP